MIVSSSPGQTFCIEGTVPSPVLPLYWLTPGFNLVCAQTNAVATYEMIVGRAPPDGAQFYRFNAGPGRNPFNLASPDYTIYTFAGGVWSPGVPTADIGEAVWIYEPRTLGNAAVAGGKFQFDFVASPGTTNRVEYSEDLTTNVWQVITNVVPGYGLTSGTQVIEDDMNSSITQRFYRVIVNGP